jgi:hypothetical protein
MNPILKNILAAILGFVAGSATNIGLIMLGSIAITAPAGIDPMDGESIKANIHLFEFKDFIFPFLAHALGTFVGALVALKLAASNHQIFAYSIGVFFMLGGIMNVAMIGGPIMFIVADILLAYIPMSYLAIKLSK